MLDIIYILNGNWGTDHRRPQMEAMGALCDLICIEKPLSLIAIFKNPRTFLQRLRNTRKMRRVGKNLKISKPVAFVPYSLAEKTFILRFINRFFLNYFVQRKILPYAKNPVILMLSHPFQRSFVGLFKEEILCYEITDAYDKITFFSKRQNKRISRIEKEVLSKADIVFTSARGLKLEKQQYNKNIHFIPNGADVGLFSRSLDPDVQIPEDLGQISPPRIGIIGHITINVDLELLQMMAESHPEWSIIFIGEIKESRKFTKGDILGKIGKYPNVHFLGVKLYRTLPLYQKGIEVALLPYKLNQFNYYVYPNKLHQYLAGGKPVVSTDLPEVRPFGNVISIAESKEEFIDMVDRALKSKDSHRQIEERVHIARENSVGKRAKQRVRLLKEALHI